MSEHAQSWQAHRELRKHPGEHPAPMISASQWINTRGISSGQFRDKVVLLDFWGNWCGPCVRNLPRIQALYQKYKDRGLIVIGVHSAQGAQSVAAFLANHAYAFPVAIDTGATADRFGVEGFPTYFLIDKSGQQIWKFGHEPPSEQQIENLLKR
jgi:thiol-disulfide isomerase/thioredoxin